jgi:hypothetical protein
MARVARRHRPAEVYVTLLWFFVWLIWDLVGDEEPLTFDPVNFWAGSFMFVVAVDLAGIHALKAARR